MTQKEKQIQPRNFDQQRASRIVVIFSNCSDSSSFDLFIDYLSRNQKKKNKSIGGNDKTERV